MRDHYKTLGVNSSATLDEIRRAYRILARRYHPDLNPGTNTEEKFKAIAAAYQILGDPSKKEAYDLEYERIQFDALLGKFKKGDTYQHAGRRGSVKFGQVPKSEPEGKTKKRAQPEPQGILAPLNRSYEKYKKKLKSILRADSINKTDSVKSEAESVRKVSIIEVSLSIRDAIFGIKKTVEIPEPEGLRKVSVVIPPGVRAGSVVRMVQDRVKGRRPEELVIIVRVAAHPFVSIQAKGLVIEVPVSISEALFGASVSLPTLDEPVIVKIPAGSQSGSEIRIKGKGIKHKDGTSGDIIYKIFVKIPDSINAVGIKEKLKEFEEYYEESPRKGYPNNILNFE